MVTKQKHAVLLFAVVHLNLFSLVAWLQDGIHGLKSVARAKKKEQKNIFCPCRDGFYHKRKQKIQGSLYPLTVRVKARTQRKGMDGGKSMLGAASKTFFPAHSTFPDASVQ